MSDKFEKVELGGSMEPSDEQVGHVSGTRIVKGDETSERSISEFTFSEIKANSKIKEKRFHDHYQKVHSKEKKKTKNTHFQLNPIVRKSIGADDEDERVIEEQVKKRVNMVREKAKKEGYEEGVEKGRIEAREDAFRLFKLEGDRRIAQFDKFISSCEKAKNDIFEENKNFLIDLIFRIAKTVTLKEIKEDKRYFVRIASELIERIGVKDNIKITVNPDDEKTIEMLSPEIKKQASELKNLHIEVSEKIRQGGCKIESDWSAIEASVEGQLSTIYDSIVGNDLNKSDVDISK